MESSVTPSTQPLLELFYRALSDDDAEVQSNAAFAVGLLVEHSEVDLSAQYLHLLAALRPLFVVAPEAPMAKLNARDNAAGAVARLILRNPAAIPFDQVLPVFLEALPLKNDFLENQPVFRTLFFLFRTNPQALYPYMDRLLAVFAHVLDPNSKSKDQIGEETKTELIQLIGALNAEDPVKVQAAGLGSFVPRA
jgi:importin-4